MLSAAAVRTAAVGLSSMMSPAVAVAARARWFGKAPPHNTPPPSGSQKQDPTPLTETVRDFLDPADFYDLLGRKGIDFYTGVPDSLLKDFCGYVTDHAPAENHVITANEGAAVAVAAGYHLATRKFPLVYMQNSGFGNAVNPLLSLADAKVYQIPMLLLIGWRGEPGKKDEPQHIVQGKVMSSLLTDCNIRYDVLPDYEEGAEEALDSAIHHLSTRSGPFALLVKRQCFLKYQMDSIEPNTHSVGREDALKIMLDELSSFDIVVSTTGFCSRELYELRELRGEGHSRDFLTVGSMGHASAIAFGIAGQKRSRQVVCFDGDGASLMHMGTLATVGTHGLTNYKHVIINNGAHDSVGGQPTGGFDLDFCVVAKGLGYKDAWTVSTEDEIANGMKRLLKTDGPALMEVLVNKGARGNLGRPKQTPIQNKNAFQQYLEL